MEITDKEKKFLIRIARWKNLYLTFSILSVIIAVFLLVYHVLIVANMNGLRFAVVILILLAGRAHLRQYRSASILHKLKLWLENLDNENKVNIKQNSD